MKVAKAMDTDVYTTAVWSPSVRIANRVAVERMAKVMKKKYSIAFSTQFV